MAAATDKQSSTKTTTGKWEGAFNAYGTAFKKLKENPEPALLFIGVYAVLAILSALMQGGQSYMDPDYNSIEDLAYLVFAIPLIGYGLSLADGKKITLGTFMQFKFRHLVFLIVATILYALIVGVSLLLLLIPAIWTIAWFYLASYPIVDKNMGPIAALKESKRLAKEHKGKVWGIIGVSILLAIPVGILSQIPYIGSVSNAAAGVWAITAAAILYRWLQQHVTTDAN